MAEEVDEVVDQECRPADGALDDFLRHSFFKDQARASGREQQGELQGAGSTARDTEHKGLVDAQPDKHGVEQGGLLGRCGT